LLALLVLVSIRTRSIDRVMLYLRNVSLRKKISVFSREQVLESHKFRLEEFFFVKTLYQSWK
jgi:hypothetical protein